MSLAPYPSPEQVAVAAEWAVNPPEKRTHLVASVPVNTLLSFAQAARDLLDLRDLLVRRKELHHAIEEYGDGADAQELTDVERALKEKSKQLAASAAVE